MPYPNTALIGFGRWGRNIARNVYEFGGLKYICDTNEKFLDSARVLYPSSSTTLDTNAIFSDSSIEGVFIATDPESHVELALRALQAGKDVFVEKPLAFTALEASTLLATAKQYQRILMVGHILWYHSAMEGMVNLIASGSIGRLRQLRAIRKSVRSSAQTSPLFSLAPHDISFFLGLTGELPDKVNSVGEHSFSFQFPSNVQASLEIVADSLGRVRTLVAIGDSGVITFDDLADWPQKLSLEIFGAPPGFINLSPDEPLKRECQTFLQSITTRKSPRTDGEEGLRVTVVLEDCMRAAMIQNTASFSH